MIRYGKKPANWIAHGGAPARCLGDCRKHGGLPSFEHEDGKLVVYDLLVCMPESDGGFMLLPRWYNSAAVIADEGMVPVHHHPGAWWQWRPCLYRRSMFGYWRMIGSQKELMWRKSLSLVLAAIYGAEDDEGEHDGVVQAAMATLEMQEAEARADELLHEFLTDFQKVQLALTDKFYVRGAATDNLYAIGLGDGFQLVDAITHEPVAFYCFHTEHWMPSADIALATKFALEDPELEVDTLENANMTLSGQREKATPELRRAHDMERELL